MDMYIIIGEIFIHYRLQLEELLTWWIAPWVVATSHQMWST